MSIGEFQLIEQYFTRTPARDDIAVGIGDDAALLRIPEGCRLIISSQCLVSGEDFNWQEPAADVAGRLWQPAVKKLRGQNAIPAWATLALCLPETNAVWLKEFSEALLNGCESVAMPLIGGDTTRGDGQLILYCHGYKR